MMSVTVNTKYGKVIGEDVSDYCTNAYIVGQEHRGKYAILKPISKVFQDDLEKASEEIMNRELKEKITYHIL